MELIPLPLDVPVTGDADLVATLQQVVALGFPRRAPLQQTVQPCGRPPSLEIRWNPRLRTTVGRVVWQQGHAVIEVSPTYHEAHPDELVETLAHEYAHVLHPDDRHGSAWRGAFSDALSRLGIPPPSRLTRARHPAPQRGRYLWRCRRCHEIVARRSRRSATEVSVRATCCDAPVAVVDSHSGRLVAERHHIVRCLRCRIPHRAYDVRDTAHRFARGHRCQCGGTLAVVSRPSVPSGQR